MNSENESILTQPPVGDENISEMDSRTVRRVLVRRPAPWMIVPLAALLTPFAFFFQHSASSASASIVPPSADTGGEDTFARELTAMRDVDRALAAADNVIAQFTFTPNKVQVPLMQLALNPFRHLDGDAVAASDNNDPAIREAREEQRLAALQAVQALKLQAIAHNGTQRFCTINSNRYQEGQEADGFLVEEIAANTVVVRRGQYRFELKMNS